MAFKAKEDAQAPAIAAGAPQEVRRIFAVLVESGHLVGTVLSIPELKLGVKGCEAVAAMLKHSQLTTLQLASNSLAGETGYVKKREVQGPSFEPGAKVSYQGREMTVSKASNGDGEIKMADLSGILALTASLSDCQSLTKLSLEFNQLGVEGGKAVAAALPSTAITNLNLSGNELGIEGGQAIAAALPRTAITKLDLEFNQLGVEGGKAVAAALPDTKIRSLNLKQNSLTVGTCKSLTALIGKTEIKELNLQSNKLDEKAKQGIRGSFKQVPAGSSGVKVLL